MSEEPVDRRLLEGMSAEAGQALVETARVHRREYELDRWLVNGRSKAPVAVAFEKDLRKGTAQRLVLKVPIMDGSEPVLTEYTRHQSALDDAPKEFAEAHHLVPLAHDPIRVGPGNWITFQAIAGDDVDSVEVLTVLLNSMLKVPGAQSPTDFEATVFARAIGDLVAGVLGRWNGRPRASRKNLTVADFLHRHLHDQLEPGGRLHALSQRHAEDVIELPGESVPLPNPLALARGAYFGDAAIVRAIIGRTHGDLHTDNVLLRVRPEVRTDGFHLIDLALYEPDGPITRDPVHLLLYILARRMDKLSVSQQEELIELLLDPYRGGIREVPPWLTAIVTAIEEAAMAWLKGTGLQPEWRQQRLLSLAGCALLFLGRTSTNPEDHAWFLRVAARAAARYVALMEGYLPEAPTTAAPTATAARRRIPWRRLPQALPTLWFDDLRLPRPEVSAILELHAVPADPSARIEARHLPALHDTLAGIGAAASLFGSGDDVRTVRSGTVASPAGAGLAVQRDGQRTAWLALPQDRLGAVLDPDDLIERLSALLAAVVQINAPRAPEIGLAVGIMPWEPYSSGSVDELPRTTTRALSSRRPLRVPADDALLFGYLDSRRRDIAEELAARLLSAPRDEDS